MLRQISYRIWLAVLMAVALATPAAALEACRDDVVHLRWQGGSARFFIEVADDFEERAQGLMFREELGKFSGMLFVYSKPQSVAFWMKDTLIPLDMIFLDATGRVVRIHENAEPLSRTPIPGGNNILAVLEINGGLARKLGIEAGAELRHPSFESKSAAWGC